MRKTILETFPRQIPPPPRRHGFPSPTVGPRCRRCGALRCVERLLAAQRRACSPLFTSRSAHRRPQRASRPPRPPPPRLPLSLRFSVLCRWCELVCLGVGRGQDRSAVCLWGRGREVGPAAVRSPPGCGVGTRVRTYPFFLKNTSTTLLRCHGAIGLGVVKIR